MKRKVWIGSLIAAALLCGVFGGLALSPSRSSIEDLLPDAVLVSSKTVVERFPGTSMGAVSRTTRIYRVSLSKAELQAAVRERGPKLGWRPARLDSRILATKKNEFNFGVNILQEPFARQGTFEVIEFMPIGLLDRVQRRWEAFWRR